MVRHYVIVGADEVLLKLVVEGLTTDLNADAQDDLDIDDLLLEGGLQDTEMALARLFDRVVLLILSRHDLIQMYLVVQKVVVVEAFERLEHLFDLSPKVLDQTLIFDPQHVLGQASAFLCHSLLLLVENGHKDGTFIVLWLHLLCLKVDDLS